MAYQGVLPDPKLQRSNSDRLFDDDDGGGGAKVTYVNYLESKGMRKIYFPLEWIGKAAKKVAVDLDGESKRLNQNFGENLDLAVPSTWWIGGA